MFTIHDGVLEKCDKSKIGSDVYIPEGVHTIHNTVFYEMEQIRRVYLPHSLKIIGGGAFGGCKNLEYVEMHEGLEELRQSAFWHCDSLTELQLPASLRVIEDDCFSHSGLTHLEIPHGVKVIRESTFWDCKALRQVQLPASVKEIHRYAFFQSGLERMILPDSVSVVGYAAFSCNSFRELVVGSPRTRFVGSVVRDETKVRSQGFSLPSRRRWGKLILFWSTVILGLVCAIRSLLVLGVAGYFYLKKKYAPLKFGEDDYFEYVWRKEFFRPWEEVLPQMEGPIPDDLGGKV